MTLTNTLLNNHIYPFTHYTKRKSEYLNDFITETFQLFHCQSKKKRKMLNLFLLNMYIFFLKIQLLLSQDYHVSNDFLI